MAKKFVVILSIFTCICIFSGCTNQLPASKGIKISDSTFFVSSAVTAEIGEPFRAPNVSSVLKDIYYKSLVSITSPDNDKIPLKNNTFTPTKFGKYNISYKISANSSTIKKEATVKIVDTVKPQIQLYDDIGSYNIGDNIPMPKTNVVDKSQEVIVPSFEVLYNGTTPVSLKDNKIISAKSGFYNVIIKATDKSGNKSEQEVLIRVKNPNELESFDYERYVDNVVKGFNLVDLSYNSNKNFVKDGDGSLKMTAKPYDGEYWPRVTFVNPGIKDISNYYSISFWVYNANKTSLDFYINSNSSILVQANSWKKIEITKNDYAKYGIDPSNINGFYLWFRNSKTEELTVYIDSFFASIDNETPKIILSMPPTDSVVGQEYVLSSATAFDHKGNPISSTVSVFYMDKPVILKSGKFTPKSAGVYTAIYEATDKFGNTAQVEYAFLILTKKREPNEIESFDSSENLYALKKGNDNVEISYNTNSAYIKDGKGSLKFTGKKSDSAYWPLIRFVKPGIKDISGKFSISFWVYNTDTLPLDLYINSNNSLSIPATSWKKVEIFSRDFENYNINPKDITNLYLWFNNEKQRDITIYIDSFVSNDTKPLGPAKQRNEIESFDYSEYLYNIRKENENIDFSLNTDVKFIKDGAGSLKMTAKKSASAYWPKIEFIDPGIKNISADYSVSFWVYNDSNRVVPLYINGNGNLKNLPSKEWTKIEITKKEWSLYNINQNNITGFYLWFNNLETEDITIFIDSFVVNEFGPTLPPRQKNEIEFFDIPEYLENVLIQNSNINISYNEKKEFIKDGAGSLKMTAKKSASVYWPSITFVNPAIKNISAYYSISFWVYNDSNRVVPLYINGNGKLKNLPSKEWTKIEITKKEWSLYNIIPNDLTGFYLWFNNLETEDITIFIDSFVVNESEPAPPPRQKNEIESFDIPEYLENVLIQNSNINISYNEKKEFIKDGAGSLKMTAKQSASVYWPSITFVNPAIKNISADYSISFWVYNDSNRVVPLYINGNGNLKNLPSKEWTKIEITKKEWSLYNINPNDLTGFYLWFNNLESEDITIFIDSFVVNESEPVKPPRLQDEIESFDSSLYLDDILIQNSNIILSYNENKDFIKDGAGSLKMTAKPSLSEYWPRIILMSPGTSDISGYDAISFWVYNTANSILPLYINSNNSINLSPNAWTYIEIQKKDWAFYGINDPKNITGFYLWFHNSKTEDKIIFIDSIKAIHL